jgi:hypothetical protein
MHQGGRLFELDVLFPQWMRFATFFVKEQDRRP